MGTKDANWIREAFDDYRRGRAELAALKRLKRDGAGYFVDELSDVLLDLKQAVINVDQMRAWLATLELNVLRSEIDDFLKGGLT